MIKIMNQENMFKMSFNFFFFFDTTTVVGRGLPVPTDEVSLAFFDLMLP